MTVTAATSSWLVRQEGDQNIVVLSGDWTDVDATAELPRAQLTLERPGLHAVSFDSSGLSRWNSSLLLFIASLRTAAQQRSIQVNDSGLPASAPKLLSLLTAELPPPIDSGPAHSMTERVGVAVLAHVSGWNATAVLIGEQVLGGARWVRGRAMMRKADLLRLLSDAGVGALPMVALVNLMVGGILAFVGVVQLQRFGASIYVADLVGVGMVREMAPLMTAIVMSGRTGSAYAAELATMEGSGQTDALRTFGIPITDYLILPRVLALTAMMPLLYLYGSVIGIGGGLGVAVVVLDLSPAAFFTEMRSTLTGAEVIFGLFKSVAFGAWVGLVACRIGLEAGRSTAGVSTASTRAAVAGIAGVIVLDAVFAACANALEI
jgi:phospholipid/cholesterol/gamma-HCH transport system permease protein